MKVILDTNVLVSGIFFSGPPHDILRAWCHGTINLIVSPEILDEYYRVAQELSKQFSGVELEPFLQLLSNKANIVDAPPLLYQICDDQDDDKFLACALASGTRMIISGDKAMLRISGYKNIQVLNPRHFADQYLSKKKR